MSTGELEPASVVGVGGGEVGGPADRQSGVGERQPAPQRALDLSLADHGAVDEQRHVGRVELDRERVRPRLERRRQRCVDSVHAPAREVVDEAQVAVDDVERPAAEHRALRHEYAVDRRSRPRRTWAVTVCGRLRMLTATLSGTGARPGQYTYRCRGATDDRRSSTNAENGRLSSGSTSFASASTHQRSIIAASRSGWSAARS